MTCNEATKTGYLEKRPTFFPCLCHQPHRCCYSLSQRLGSTLRGNNTLAWLYLCAHPRVRHQNKINITFLLLWMMKQRPLKFKNSVFKCRHQK